MRALLISYPPSVIRASVGERVHHLLEDLGDARAGAADEAVRESVDVALLHGA